MAQVYRPTYSYTEPKTGKKVKRLSRRWHIRFYSPDGQRHHVKGYRDRKATEALATELEKRGLTARVDTGGRGDIHTASYKSYHTVTPNGFDLQISATTRVNRGG